jgi:glycosyltransferase involved in cell wall biosynthesis
MRVAVNTRLLIPGKMEGIGWFTHEILQRVVRNHPEVEFHFFFDRPWDPQFIYGPNVKPWRVWPPARRPWLFDLWFDWAIPFLLHRIKADVFVSPDGLGSLRCPIPQHITLHDLNFMHFPQHMHPRYRAYLPKRTKDVLEQAQGISTVSAFSAQDIQNTFACTLDISVIYNAASDVFRVLDANSIAAVREKYAEGRPYFLFVSSIHPRKNLLRTIEAFDLFRQQYAEPMKLVIVGRRFWLNDAIDQAIDRLQSKGEIIFTGHLEQAELARVTAAAHALVYASLYEGFGIPIIEAMQCGVPVITSNCSSMPEVAGGAALLVNPESTDDIAQAMLQLISQPLLVDQLREQGLLRAREFSWENSAIKYWDAIKNTVPKP